jgi:acetyl-CoA acyltransferase
VPVDVNGTIITVDEGIRGGTSAETLGRLKPAFKEDDVIHAGNSLQISGGAGALVVTTPERASTLGLTPIVRYHSGAVSGADAIMMLTGPIPATEKLLKRSGLAIGGIGAFRSTRRFRRCRWPGLPRPALMLTASTRSVARSHSDIRSVDQGRS